MCLLLRFTQQRIGKAPHNLDLTDLDAPLIAAFLDYLEAERGVCVRTRNARLTAIRSLFNFAAFRCPEHSATIQRVLAIPQKKNSKALVTYLTDQEMAALLAAPTTPQGSVAGTTCYSCSHSRPVSASANSSNSPAAHWTSAAAATCAAPAREERTDHTAATPDPGGAPRLARRTKRRRRRPPVRRPQRQPAQPRCGAATRRTARRNRRGPVQIIGHQENLAPHTASQLRDEPASSRGRSRDDRALARP